MTQQKLEGVQQELEKATSAVQKLSDSLSAKEKCLEAHHANQKVTIYIVFYCYSMASPCMTCPCWDLPHNSVSQLV